MTQAAQLTAAFQAVAAQIKTIKTTEGSLAALTTASKTSLVSAINELVTTIASLSGGGAAILDTATDTTHVWSASKVIAAIAQAKTDLINGAPAALDTLNEIVTQLGTDETAISGLLTAVGNRVSFADVQSLTAPQQLQACTNIGVGDPTTDFAGVFAAALV